MKKVYYCEFLAFGNPIERELDYEEALKRYYAKLKALEGYIFKETCFIGIKDLSGNWIITNEKK